MKRKGFLRGVGMSLAFILCLNMIAPAYASSEIQEEVQISPQETENESTSSDMTGEDSEIKAESKSMQTEQDDDLSQVPEIEAEDAKLVGNQAELSEGEKRTVEEIEEDQSTEELDIQDQENNDQEIQNIPSEDSNIITEDGTDNNEASSNNDNGIATYSTNRTQSEAIQWVKSQVGKSLDMDGAYGAQCVDLILAYYDYLGVPRSSGNGADYTWNTLPSGWQRLQGATPQPGDILVYTGGYGHVAIYESDYSTYHQNFNGHSYVERITYRYNGLSNPYWGVIRPDWNSYTQASITFSNDDCQWDTTNAYIYTKANANFRGTFTAAGMTVWDANGNVVASKNETISTNGSYLEIWYNITNDTGVKLNSGQRYTYQFYTVFNGTKFYGVEKSFTTNSIAPSSVTGLKATVAGSRKVTLSWTSSPNADGYIIYRQIGNNGKFSYRYTVTGTSYTDTSASNYIYNFYRVYPYCYDGNGVRIMGGSNTYVYARPTLTAVNNLKASENGPQIKLTWSSVNSADGYIIYRKEGNGAFKYCYMVRGTSYTDATAPIGKYNFYRIYPYEYVNNTRHIGPSTAYVYGKPTLKAVTNLKAIGQSKAVKITWTASTRATGYFVYKKGSNGKFGYIGYTNGTSYIDKKASKNTYNFYRVYPYYKPTKNSQRVMGPSNAYVYAKAK